MKTMTVPLVIPGELRSNVARVARRAKTKQSDVYRLAIRCGLAEAERRLVSDSDRLFPNINPLPGEVLNRWYHSEESKEWDNSEATATRAQSIPQLGR